MRNWDLSRGYRVYFNLHKRCCSVQAWDVDKKGWRLYKHSWALHLKDIKTQVNENSRQKVIAEKKKSVHAFLNARVADCITKEEGNQPKKKFKRICCYNPYRYGYFFNAKTEKPVSEMKEAVLRSGIIFY